MVIPRTPPFLDFTSWQPYLTIHGPLRRQQTAVEEVLPLSFNPMLTLPPLLIHTSIDVFRGRHIFSDFRGFWWCLSVPLLMLLMIHYFFSESFLSFFYCYQLKLTINCTSTIIACLSVTMSCFVIIVALLRYLYFKCLYVNRFRKLNLCLLLHY